MPAESKADVIFGTFEPGPATGERIPAVRANDTTDVHIARGSVYASEPARPFRSLSLDPTPSSLDVAACTSGVDARS